MVILNFIRDSEAGIFARAKRLGKEESEKADRNQKKVEARDEISANDKSEWDGWDGGECSKLLDRAY